MNGSRHTIIIIYDSNKRIIVCESVCEMLHRAT